MAAPSPQPPSDLAERAGSAIDANFRVVARSLAQIKLNVDDLTAVARQNQEQIAALTASMQELRTIAMANSTGIARIETLATSNAAALERTNGRLNRARAALGDDDRVQRGRFAVRPGAGPASAPRSASSMVDELLLNFGHQRHCVKAASSEEGHTAHGGYEYRKHF